MKLIHPKDCRSNRQWKGREEERSKKYFENSFLPLSITFHWSINSFSLSVSLSLAVRVFSLSLSHHIHHHPCLLNTTFSMFDEKCVYIERREREKSNEELMLYKTYLCAYELNPFVAHVSPNAIEHKIRLKS